MQPRKCTLVGSTNEVFVTIDNNQTTTLVDTRSLISTICQIFKEHLYNTALQPLSNILHVECADGQSLPYLGCIQCSLRAKGFDNDQVCVDGLLNFLLLPNIYNRSVPVLIGTNIISVLMNMVKESHGPRYLQEEHMFAPWHLAFRCASLNRVDPKV